MRSAKIVEMLSEHLIKSCRFKASPNKSPLISLEFYLFILKFLGDLTNPWQEQNIL